LANKLSARRSELLDKAMSFILLNMLWAIFASFILTLPAATAGLFATLTPWVRGDTSEPFRDFFGGMRQHWKQSTLIVLLDMGIGGLIVFNLSILDTMELPALPALLSRNVAFLFIVMTLLANLYLWPLLVTFDLSIRQLIKVSLKLVFLHPLWSIFATTLALLPLLLGLLLPRFIAVLLAFSSCALLGSWGAWRVIGPYQHDLFNNE
jgi:uncharacterized membrane protein YesL